MTRRARVLVCLVCIGVALLLATCTAPSHLVGLA